MKQIVFFFFVMGLVYAAELSPDRLNGTWSWSNKASPCTDSTLVIKYLKTENELNFKQSYSFDFNGKTTNEYSYNIQSINDSTLHLNLKGEFRKTLSSELISWYLIYKGEKLYWKRSDWADGKHTKAIIKCDYQYRRGVTYFPYTTNCMSHSAVGGYASSRETSMAFGKI